MKKYTVAAIIICLLCALSVGCADGGDAGASAGPPNAAASGSGAQTAEGGGVQDGDGADASGGAAADPGTATDPEAANASAKAKTKEEEAAAAAAALEAKVDVDFMGLNTILLQAELNNLRTNADKYMGKTIRLSGPYYSIFLPETNTEYHFVTVVKGDACCVQGMEFRLNEEGLSQGDYPEANRDIVVIGTLDKYEEWGSMYLYVSADMIAFI